ncbi:MAG: hypothetical protein HY868_11115 [Chloroflexi bacterium]|nr:hypothetical protein [Chloroflexota bacterium]
MKTEINSSPMWKDIALFFLAYLLWLMNIVVCMVALLQFRSAVNALWPVFGGDRYALGLVNQLSILLGGLAAFVYVMFLESVYRTSVTHRDEKSAAQALAQPQTRRAPSLTDSRLVILLKKFAITTAIPLAAWLASLGGLEIALRALQ